MSQRMLARYFLLPTIGRLSLCMVVLRTDIIWLFGVIFRLFQSCPYDYQTNDARIRVTGIVGILTHPLNCADSFRHSLFCLTLFCLPSIWPAVNSAFVHKMAGPHDGEPPQNVLWNNLQYFRVLVFILCGKCSNLPDLLTTSIGRSSLAIVVIWSCCFKFRLLCYCRQRSWLGLVYIPFPQAWGVISYPFLHYRTFLQVLLPRRILRRGGEGMHSQLLLCWFVEACRRFDSIQGRSAHRNFFLRTIPPEMMCLSVLLIACRSANIVFSRLDELWGNRATSLRNKGNI